MRFHPLPLLLALAALSACAGAPRLDAPPIAAAAQPRFDALAFFTGRSEGLGRLSKVFSRTVPTRVESEGRVVGGVLHLTQVVQEGNKPARTREWAIREDRPGHYTGTLTEAAGAVTGETVGNRLHLAFRLKSGGLPVEQWLTLSPDGLRAYNVLTVRKLGVTVAVLSEDIRRIG
ncbi:MAG TPA: DUF3833 family protein [Croceibacterium sp.]|jgi:hypothetical protein